MLVLSREIGQSIVIEDVLLTLLRIDEEYVEFSLTKLTGGKPKIVTLPHREQIEICYEVQVALIQIKGSRARFGFEYPPEVEITRHEFLE
ncbi:MAG TPA: hypothetical protein VMM56_07675 [Planctomycetaceae bacterium]|nr:hypothetical protein [Planctomycetaceae bacterium]